MKFYILIILLVIAARATAQQVTDARQLLRQKDFRTFKNYTDSPRANVEFQVKLIREIMPGFWEGVLKIEDFRQRGDDTTDRRHLFQITLLSTDNYIFFYRCTEFKSSRWNHKGYWAFTDSVPEAFKDKHEYKRFEQAYLDTYKGKLNTNELFLTHIIYGGACGIGGDMPEYQQKLNELLTDDDIDALNNWLKSPNTEKQLYALQGLKMLKNEGYRLTGEQQHIANIVKSKKGVAMTCSGCVFYKDSIRDVVADINSFQGIRRQKANGSYYVFGAIIVAFIALVFYFRRKIAHSLKT
jgi:hypothetical protein